MIRKKKLSLLACILSVLLMGTWISGCSLVKVNPEKDSAQTLMTIGEDVVTKSVFNNNMAYIAMNYAASGSALPTGKELETLKENMLSAIVQTEVLAAKGKKDGLEVDEAAAKKSGKEAYTTIKENVDKKYNSILTAWNTNDESFKDYMIQNAIKADYATAAETAFNDHLKKNPDEFLGVSVGKINDEDVTRGEYHYYFIKAYLNAYMTAGSAPDISDQKAMKTMNADIFNEIGLNRAMIKYCEEQKIEISKDSIASQQKDLQTSLNTFFEDDSSLGSFTEQYQLTVDQFKKYQAEEAKAKAAVDAVIEKYIQDTEVSDQEIQKRYNKEKDTYDPSTVSACHILSSDQKLANEVYDKAKDCKSKSDFEKVMKEYDGKESIDEATDLGSFDKTKMVAEFTKAAFGMEVNTVSKPVKTEFGYHVIFVYDKNEVKDDKWEDHKDEIQSTILNEQSDAYITSLQNDLKKSVKPSFGEIKLGIEGYIETLKTELKVTVDESVIR